MQIAILVYDHVTALDAVGVCEVVSRLPGAETVLVGERRGPVRCDVGSLTLVADATLDEVAAPDVLVVPGWSGLTQERLLRPGPVQDWVRHADERTTWTASVGTGAVVLATAGLLEGRRAATHWLAVEWLAGLGVLATGERVTRDGKYFTAAGVSAAVDMALALVATAAGDETAKAIQLLLQYDPAPPFDAGAVERAPAEIVLATRAVRDFILFGRRGDAPRQR